jgi:hypothetical protein
MFYPHRSTFGEWRLSSTYSPTLRSRNYKDPVLVIETEDEADTDELGTRWNEPHDKG